MGTVGSTEPTFFSALRGLGVLPFVPKISGPLKFCLSLLHSPGHMVQGVPGGLVFYFLTLEDMVQGVPWGHVFRFSTLQDMVHCGLGFPV